MRTDELDIAQLADLAAEVRRLGDLVESLGTVPAPLIDADAAAELLAVPPSWVLAEARASRIPHRKLGRYVRFSPTELIAWVDRGAVGPRQNRRHP